MVYNTQNYWGFGLFLSSGILETRKHDVSETGCFRPQLRGRTYSVGSLRKSRPRSVDNPCRVKSCVTTYVQSASLSWNKAPTWCLRTVRELGFVDVGRSLWREDGSVIYNCCWSSSAHSFSGPSPVGLTTIFCRLRFDTSLFVASYDLQGHGVGIRPRLRTGYRYN
jgi:hypothetical protein